MKHFILSISLVSIALLAGCSNTTYIMPKESCRKSVGVFIPIEDCTRPNQPIRGETTSTNSDISGSPAVDVE